MDKIDTEEYIRKHIERVKKWLFHFSNVLWAEGENHDKTKLQEPEFSQWKKMDEEPRYKYDTEEYKEKLKRYAPLLREHYSKNRHHPEYFQIHECEHDRDLIDLITMIADWLGYREIISYSEASELVRTQCKRYGFSEELETLILNTLSHYFVTFGGESVINLDKLQNERLQKGRGQIVDITL